MGISSILPKLETEPKIFFKNVHNHFSFISKFVEGKGEFDEALNDPGQKFKRGKNILRA